MATSQNTNAASRTEKIDTSNFDPVDADSVELELEQRSASEASLVVEAGVERWELDVDADHTVRSDEDLPVWLETLLAELNFWLAD